jgi:hypothetical protein
MRVEIEVIAGPARGAKFVFDEPDCFLFGRSTDARVSLPNDPYVSRNHFLLEVFPPDCRVTDLNSKNGLFVNGVRYGGRKPPDHGVQQAPHGATETLLYDGDGISVGDTQMRVGITLDTFCHQCGAPIQGSDLAQLNPGDDPHMCANCRALQRTVLPPGGQPETVTHTPKPGAGRRQVWCACCGTDVTDEAGLRGQAEGAEYVCKVCQAQAWDDPMQLLERILREGVDVESVASDFKGYEVLEELGRSDRVEQ